MDALATDKSISANDPLNGAFLDPQSGFQNSASSLPGRATAVLDAPAPPGGSEAVRHWRVDRSAVDRKTHPLSEETVDVPELSEVASAVKRLLDIVVSAAALLCSSPLWAGMWLVNALTDRGPLLYVHTRVGQDGRHFDCFKFRTMVPNADKVKQQIADDSHHDDPRTFKMKRDPRVTPIGRWLRKLSLDEVPQLVNVLVGDMSLVGPRPPIPSEVELYSPRDWTRLRVKPGLTCIWQVSGRSDIAFEQQLEMDIEYIERQSVLFDLQLIARTVPAVLTCRGAY